MCCDKSLSTHLQEHREDIELAGNKYISSEGIGQVCVETETSKINLQNVLYVPHLKTNFLSVTKIAENNCTVEFNKDIAIVKSMSGMKVMQLKRSGDLFIYEMMKNKLYLAASNDNLLEWHRRYGHLNIRSLELLCAKDMVRGMDVKKVKDFDCDVCLKGKISALPFPKCVGKSSTRVLEIVHSDVCGPMKTPSLSGAKFFVTFVDDFSRKIFVYFIKNKSDVFKTFKIFKAAVELETGEKVKMLRSDNGGEYVNREFTEFLKQEGIRRQLTVPYTPQQNGIAERVNRTLVEMGRCMIIDSSVCEFLWAEAINTAVFLRNRSPTKVLQDLTPYEAWGGRKPNVSYLEVFGRKGIVLDKMPKRSKFSAKGNECIMVGYAEESKAYRLYDKGRRTVIVARDVRFLRTDNVPCSSKAVFDDGFSDSIFNTKVDVKAPLKDELKYSDEDDFYDAAEDPDVSAGVPATSCAGVAETSCAAGVPATSCAAGVAATSCAGGVDVTSCTAEVYPKQSVAAADGWDYK